MQAVIHFFEYTLSGWVYFIYFILMVIFSLACLGVVGDKVSKKRQAELIAKREKTAQAEYKKAQELIEKQANSYSVSNVLDPTAKAKSQQTIQNSTNVMNNSSVQKDAPVVSGAEENASTNLSTSTSKVDVSDNSATNTLSEVSGVSTPVIDNTSEEAIKTDVPSVLVINDDGTSNVSS